MSLGTFERSLTFILFTSAEKEFPNCVWCVVVRTSHLFTHIPNETLKDTQDTFLPIWCPSVLLSPEQTPRRPKVQTLQTHADRFQGPDEPAQIHHDHWNTHPSTHPIMVVHMVSFTGKKSSARCYIQLPSTK